MKSIRLFLYALIGVVLIALWSAWEYDYPEQKVLNTTTTKAITAVESALNIKQDAQQKTTTTPNAQIATNQAAAAKDILYKTPKARLINVHTDILDISIDRLGGTLVSAKLLKYPKTINQKNNPIQILNDDPNDIYTATSGISANTNNKLPNKIPYLVSQKTYVLAPDQNKLQVKLLWKSEDGLVVNKTLTFQRGKYAIGVDYTIQNQGSKPFNGQLFSQITKKLVAQKSSLFSLRTFMGAAISSQATPYEKLKPTSLIKDNLSREIKGGWLAMQQRYFLSALIPNQQQTLHYYSNFDKENGNVNIGYARKLNLDSQGSEKIHNTIYIGPEITANLKPLAPHLEKTVDYGWLWFISEIIFWLMNKIYLVVGNWGWSIILVTLLIKIMFYKFSEKSYVSMAKMRELAPRIKSIQEQFGKDKQKISRATMELYRREKVNPLGGCLPIAIQIPVFIALYYVLLEAVQLRQAPFIFWIHDLSIKDPFYILPILMGISMFVQQKLNPAPPDPAQAKMMMILPVVFTVFFASFPAGLVLYWLVNNVLSAAQQWYIMRKVAAKHFR